MRIIRDYISKMSIEELSKHIDNTMLKPEVGVKGVMEFIEKSLNYNFACLDKKIKASGGIRTLIDTIHYIMLGADRIGTSSGIEIVKEFMKIKGLTDEATSTTGSDRSTVYRYNP